MIVQLWNTNTSSFVSCDADLTENYMYISMKFGTGVHVFCWEVGVFNRSSFQSVSYKILIPVKFLRIPFGGFRGEVKNVSANLRPGRPSCFSDHTEKHKLGRGRWDLPSCQVLLNSVKWFQRSGKSEKLTIDGRRTTRDHNIALEPSAQVH